MIARKTGFTLIEVLIAVAIFAIMSAFAYRALGSILNTRERVEQENQKWREVSSFFARLEADFANTVARRIRNSSDRDTGAFIGNQTYTSDSEGQVMFTRMGLPGATGTMAAPQRLGYRLKQGVVEELIWPALDQGPRTVPAVHPLLSKVDALTIRYRDQANAWQTTWPPVTTASIPPNIIPKAVEVALTLESGETITRVLIINLES